MELWYQWHNIRKKNIREAYTYHKSETSRIKGMFRKVMNNLEAISFVVLKKESKVN